MKIFRLSYKEIITYIDWQYPKLTDVQKTWMYVYVAQGSSGILNYWISSEMKQEPKEVADFIESLIASMLKNVMGCKLE